MTAPLPAGTVTIADLYRELTGMRADVTRALTRIEVIDSRDTDHEARIRILERFRYTLMGVAVVVGAGSGYIGYLLGHAAR
jgi:hypothetical protein